VHIMRSVSMDGQSGTRIATVIFACNSIAMRCASDACPAGRGRGECVPDRSSRVAPAG
jgi:hypothetical protein